MIRAPRPRRLGGLVAVGLVVAAASAATGQPPASAATALTLSVSAVPEAPEFATTSYADPWDFSESTDLSPVPGVRTSGVTAAVYRDGRMDFDAARGAYLELADTTVGALAHGRDTTLYPLDAAQWSRLSVRMWSSVAGTAQVFWFSCQDKLPHCSGATSFGLRQGWNVYDVAMTNTTGTPAPWAGNVRALRLVPSATSAGSFQLDAVRLYAPTPASQVTLTRSGASGSATLLVDPDATVNGNEAAVGSIGTSRVFDASLLPPGRWYLAVSQDGTTTYATTPLDVDGTPRPVVLQPDLAGGRDYAEMVRGDRWDFAQSSDAGPAANLSQLHVDGQVLNGRNGGPDVNDPQVGLPLAAPIDGSRFHRLSMRLSYDGPMGLQDAPGGGMLARLIWQVEGAGPNDYQDLDDVVVSPGDQTITLDLATDPSATVVDANTPRRIGWAGQRITSLRFDANEDPSPRSWRIDDISIAEDDRGVGGFDIVVADANSEPGTVADVYVDTDAAGLDGTLVQAGVAVGTAPTTVRWDAAGAPGGRYWVYLVVHDGRTTRAAYSRAPFVLEAAPAAAPVGSLDRVVPTPGGLLVEGWAADPGRPAAALPVHVYVDGAPAAVFAADRERADVARAHPALGAAHGFSATLTGLRPGPRTVCAYAFRGPAGPNPSLGCRRLDIAGGAPLGSLDAVSRAPGGIRVSGWGIDPSTTSGIDVHLYVDGTAVAVLPASASRPDVGRAHPGYGDGHGFGGLVAMPGGAHRVCAYGIDSVAPGSNALLGCRDIDLVVDPLGSLDDSERGAGRLVLRGWALDPDTAAPAAVHVYVGAAFAGARRAELSRPDIGAAYPDHGDAHGFEIEVDAGNGGRACAYALNAAGAGSSRLLGCGG